MNCLSPEQLVALALADLATAPSSEWAAARHHLHDCDTCAGAWKRVQEVLRHVADLHARCERDHEEGRERLLVALGGVPAEHGVQPGRKRFPVLKEVGAMRRWLVGSAAAVAVLGMLLVWAAARLPSALAQTAAALGKVQSYQCRLAGLEAGADEDKGLKEVGRLYWAVPGSYRTETYEGGKPVTVRILIRGKPGLEIDHKDETYRWLEPLHQPDSPVLLLNELARFAGQADRELPERTIQGQAVRGFEIALDKIDADCGDGTLRVWPDVKTKLPLRVELEVLSSTIILEDFAWNVPSGEWFRTEPPAKYQDKTPGPASAEEQTKHIVDGLKAYVKYCGGKYPPVKVVYGDVASERLFRAAGLSSPSTGLSPEESRTDAAVECWAATFGFAWMNTIQRHNPDAAYYGKTVSPEDPDKVLFRWKLADNSYQVIFGDLRAQVVTAERLKELEKR